MPVNQPIRERFGRRSAIFIFEQRLLLAGQLCVRQSLSADRCRATNPHNKNEFQGKQGSRGRENRWQRQRRREMRHQGNEKAGRGELYIIIIRVRQISNLFARTLLEDDMTLSILHMHALLPYTIYVFCIGLSRVRVNFTWFIACL